MVAKTDQPDPRLAGTVHTAVEEISRAGGTGLACVCDIRHEEQVQAAVDKVVATFGGIDVLVNNAQRDPPQRHPRHADEALRPEAPHQYPRHVPVLETLPAASAEQSNPHILNISPPLNMEARSFAPHVAYTMAKFGMSLCVLGVSEEFKQQGVAYALWPKP